MLIDCHIYHEQIQFLKSLGLIPFPIAGYENGMMLCPNCHTFFGDMLNPGWIFVPSDLDYFIEYELENRKTRQNHPKRAPVRARGALDRPSGRTRRQRDPEGRVLELNRCTRRTRIL